MLLHHLNGHPSLWKIPVARAASALVFSKIPEKCSTFTAPLEAITGMVTLSRMWLISSMLKLLLVPSLSMQFRGISTAPSISKVWASCNASTSLSSRPPFTVHWYQQYLERKIKSCFLLISYCDFTMIFEADPTTSQTQKVLLRIFFLLKIFCFDWGRNFDPPRTHQWVHKGWYQKLNISLGTLSFRNGSWL